MAFRTGFPARRVLDDRVVALVRRAKELPDREIDPLRQTGHIESVAPAAERALV